MRMRLIVLAVALILAAEAQAAEKIKVGMLTTLSGPGSPLGVEVRDGFSLALKHIGGTLGGLPAEVIVSDDALNPDLARQMAERMLKRDQVDVMTGIIFSNVMLAVGPAVFESQTFYLSANAGPSQLAGAQCNPFFFNVAWQNDNLHEAMGKHVADKGFKNVVALAPNYPAGKDAITGFRRFYRATLADEIYTALNQLDYAAEIAQIRARKPDAVYFFLPGGMGINFIKQYGQSGLGKDIPLFAPGFSADEDVIRAVGEPMLGMFNSSQWAQELDNPQNKKFVADFEKDYGRIPTLYASQGYDAAMLLNGAVRDVKGRVADKAAFRKALQAAHFSSVRGPFKFNGNHYPIQNYYLRQVVKDGRGRITNKLMGTIFTNQPDAYAGECKMP
ncbi:MAG TPA: ABC transporter substrate-binding protein [Candidatus Methylomirabilis sp.]|nr:ABC transporter substrate-binding protein [Candidatus Methylomirabilis sp.]